MCNREHRKVILETNKDHVIRKIVNRKLSCIRIADAGDNPAGVREQLEMLQRLPHFSREPHGDIFISFAVPRDRILKLPASTRA